DLAWLLLLISTEVMGKRINADPRKRFVRKDSTASLARLEMHRLCVFAFALVAISCLVIAPASAASSPGRVEFEVLRNGQPFGRQGVTVTESGGQLIAQTSAALHAGLGPVTLFSYTQRCSETWRAGALTNLRRATRQNGRSKSVEGGLADG